ncbi:TetR family transcriptional regulator [Jatrophihabitans sp. GAS493]|uniref:TetR family transcriptional regulator n=1 Tax=Jatrophihabitans sp. GAS493 TaxID=1907575 RepID=UPI000BB7525E|nr:TetR family transcriptional regulator [Jatrophihabitans sp. GAS493]SOD72782.1 TetR family transcriptional regulator [Jatrophihabitans sp. GAS493]
MTEAVTRAERKQRTHQALLDAALEQLHDRSLSSLSLREVSRSAGVVPTAFYRHFDSMEDLGVTLVDQAMRSLRQMLRDARRNPTRDPVVGSVAILQRQVRANEDHFRFLLRERNGGVTDVRRAISAELRLFTSELSTDLASMPVWKNAPIVAELDIAADLMVSAMLTIVQELLEIDVAREAPVIRRAEKQLRLIVIGMIGWRAQPS